MVFSVERRKVIKCVPQDEIAAEFCIHQFDKIPIFDKVKPAILSFFSKGLVL